MSLKSSLVVVLCKGKISIGTVGLSRPSVTQDGRFVVM